MTTIAYRDGILAADSRETDDKGYVLTDSSLKLYRVDVPNHGECLLGGAGDSESIERLRRALIAGEDIELEDTEALLILPDGAYFLYEGHIWTEGLLPYYALGTGGGYATAAFRAGADAIRACEIGAAMDPLSGGEISVLTTEQHKSRELT